MNEYSFVWKTAPDGKVLTEVTADCTLFVEYIKTGISLSTLNTSHITIYDLQGRRVGKAIKGIYIVNGKKVVIK